MTKVHCLRSKNLEQCRKRSHTQPSRSSAPVNQPPRCPRREVERFSLPADLGSLLTQRAAASSTESQEERPTWAMLRRLTKLFSNDSSPPSPVRTAANSTEFQEERPTMLHRLSRLFSNDSSPPSPLSPGVNYKLHWKECANAPLRMVRAQAVVVGEKVFVGGGSTTIQSDPHKVFQYIWREDTWSTLPCCPVRSFGLVSFMGSIITVGGKSSQGSLTGKIHAFRVKSQQWEEFLTPMATARCYVSVATASEHIISAGGCICVRPRIYSSAVEVYSSDTSQWYTADPLPIPCALMSSVIINDVWYLLGGVDQSDNAVKNCFCSPLRCLVQKAVSRFVSEPVWNQLPPTPLYTSTAVCLSGSLMAIGGMNNEKNRSAAVYVFDFLSNSWARLTNGDLLSPQSACVTAQLSPVEVITIGGWDEQDQRSKTVFWGTLHSQ